MPTTIQLLPHLLQSKVKTLFSPHPSVSLSLPIPSNGLAAGKSFKPIYVSVRNALRGGDLAFSFPPSDIPSFFPSHQPILLWLRSAVEHSWHDRRDRDRGLHLTCDVNVLLTCRVVVIALRALPPPVSRHPLITCFDGEIGRPASTLFHRKICRTIIHLLRYSIPWPQSRVKNMTLRGKKL